VYVAALHVPTPAHRSRQCSLLEAFQVAKL
jgi:hypothetical protein